MSQEFVDFGELSGPLYWEQPRARKQEYLLHGLQGLAGGLRFRSSFRGSAEAMARGAAWTFERKGFFKQTAYARLEGEPDPVAVFTPKWTGRSGEIRVPGRAAYHWETKGFLRGRVELRDPEGLILGCGSEGKRSTSGLLRTQARLDVEARARKDPQLPLLALFSWYLLLMHNRDSAAAAAR